MAVITHLSCAHPHVVEKQYGIEIASHHPLNKILKADKIDICDILGIVNPTLQQEMSRCPPQIPLTLFSTTSRNTI